MPSSKRPPAAGSNGRAIHGPGGRVHVHPQALADRRIAALWGAQLLSATGAEFYMVAVVWIASSLVGREAGYVSAMQAAALLAGSLFGGLLTDRWRHGTTMIGVSLVRAGLLLGLSLAAARGAMTLPLLAGAAGLIALATAVYDPALQAVLPVLAPDPAERHAVNGLFDATRRMARILGPSLIALADGSCRSSSSSPSRRPASCSRPSACAGD